MIRAGKASRSFFSSLLAQFARTLSLLLHPPDQGLESAQAFPNLLMQKSDHVSPRTGPADAPARSATACRRPILPLDHLLRPRLLASLNPARA